MTAEQNSNSRPVILITGGAGYIGSALIRRLAEVPALEGYTIRIYDNLVRETYQALQDLQGEARYEFIRGDVLDRANLRRAMSGVSKLIHLAALVRTPLSFDSNPVWLNQVNHWGSLAVLEEALNAGVDHFLMASSASVYGPGGPFNEADECRPVSPYAVSKLMAEKDLRSFSEDRLNLTIFRFGSVFGTAPAVRFDVVASRFVHLAGTGHPLPIHGSGEQVRPLLHVRDAADALIFALQHPDRVQGTTFNVATEQPSVNTLAQQVQAIMPGTRVRYTDQDSLSNVSLLLDTSRFVAAGFQPSVSLQEGLSEMASHWKSFQPRTPLNRQAD